MREFIKDFIPTGHQLEFAGSEFGVFNGCLVELAAIGVPGTAEDGEDEPVFKAIKKCSALYHSGSPVPTELYLISLSYQWVIEYDLTSCADIFQRVYNEYDRICPFDISHRPRRTGHYSYADPDGRKKLKHALKKNSGYISY